MVLNIDERRFKFVEYYSAIAAGSVAVVATLAGGGMHLGIAIAGSALLAVAVLIGASFLAIIHSERRANVRYREKINVIRTLFLGGSEDERIRQYLSRKDLGILTAADPQPTGVGQTLRGVLLFMYAEMGILAAGIPALWIAWAIDAM
jgi:hypothetical protein